MQSSKQFKTYEEAQDFARWHKEAWIHKVYDGNKDSPHHAFQRHLTGYLVVYRIPDEA